MSFVFAAGGFDLESQPLATPTALSARKLTKIETGQNFEPFANRKLFLGLGKLSCFFLQHLEADKKLIYSCSCKTGFLCQLTSKFNHAKIKK